MNETDPAFREALRAEAARVASGLAGALASARRLELLDLLAREARTLDALAEGAELTEADTARHLQVLREARLVDVRLDEGGVRYRLSGEPVARLWEALRAAAAARLAEVEDVSRAYREGRDGLQPVALHELYARLQREAVTVLDVRPAGEYDAGHLPGARSIPLRELEDRLAEIPREAEVIAYCRGPYCVLADEAVGRLHRHGFRARRLEAGFPDWEAAGLPVERSAHRFAHDREELVP